MGNCAVVWMIHYRLSQAREIGLMGCTNRQQTVNGLDRFAQNLYTSGILFRTLDED